MGLATERLYYDDSYLAEFPARIVGREGLRVYLDRTAFYPTSGGQPHDTGVIAGIPVTEVIDEGERIAHVTSAPVAGDEVRCRIDWARRFDHMQQHSGQHLLSAVLVEMHGFQTVGFHLGEDYSAIDIAAPALDAAQVSAVEARTNALVFENLPLGISYQDASAQAGLRKPSDRDGTLRIVSIGDADRSACGGTHVRATGEIGAVLLRKIDRAHGNVRIEFLCGARAVRRARADFEALSQVARTLTAPLDETPALVAAQFEALQAAEKARKKLAAELARAQGRELYESTAPGPGGLRRHFRRIAKGSLDEELRAASQGFTAQPKAFFLAAVEQPPAVLLGVSKDAGIHAGDALKAALVPLGGRGGGNATAAQGGVQSREALETLLRSLMELGA